MAAIEVFSSEFDLMNIIWEKNPIRMRELTTKAEQIRGWKRSTVYTMVSRLSGRGVIRFEDSTVTALYSRHDIQLKKTSEFISKTYGNDTEQFYRDVNMLLKLKQEEKKEEEN